MSAPRDSVFIRTGNGAARRQEGTWLQCTSPVGVGPAASSSPCCMSFGLDVAADTILAVLSVTLWLQFTAASLCRVARHSGLDMTTLAVLHVT
jgi:hypothetical protein